MLRRFLAFFDTPAGRATRYGFSAALIAVFIWKIDWRQLSTLQGNFTPGLVTLAALAAGITFPLHAWRWWLLLRAQGLTLSLHWAHVVTWIGNFYNAFLLGGLGGDAAKAFYVCRDAAHHQAGGLAATLLDRVMGLIVLLSITLITLLCKLDTIASMAELRLLLSLCIVACFVAVLAGLLLTRRPPAWLAHWLGEKHTATLADILRRIAADRAAFGWALALSYVIWLLDFLAVWWLAESVGRPVPFIEISLAMSVAYAATVLPISVGGHGVREGAMITMLGLLGFIPDDDARQRVLLLAVLVWAIGILWSLVGGLVLLFSRTRREAIAR
jgi:uncharacterized membrane protein YbhN (UPF0104 family)